MRSVYSVRVLAAFFFRSMKSVNGQNRLIKNNERGQWHMHSQQFHNISRLYDLI